MTEGVIILNSFEANPSNRTHDSVISTNKVKTATHKKSAVKGQRTPVETQGMLVRLRVYGNFFFSKGVTMRMVVDMKR